MALSPEEEARFEELQRKIELGTVSEEELQELQELAEKAEEPSVVEQLSEEAKERAKEQIKEEGKRLGRKALRRGGEAVKKGAEAAKQAGQKALQAGKEYVGRAAAAGGRAAASAAAAAGEAAAGAVGAVVGAEALPIILIVIGVILLVLILSQLLPLPFNHPSDANLQAGMPKIERSIGDQDRSSLAQSLAGREGLEFSEFARQDLVDSENIEELDTRVLAMLDYLSQRHEYIRVDLIRTGAPERTAFKFRSQKTEEGFRHKAQIDNSALSEGRGVMISAVDYSEISELEGEPIQFSWQKTYSEARIREDYDRLTAGNLVLMEDLGLMPRNIQADEENGGNEQSPSSRTREWILDRLSYQQEILGGLVELPGVSSVAKEYFNEANSLFGEASEMVNGGVGGDDPGLRERINQGIYYSSNGMQAANMVGWDNLEAPLEFRQAYEARSKIREVILDILRFSFDYPPLETTQGIEPDPARKQIMSPAQIITFSPEDVLDRNAPNLDVYPPGPRSVSERGVNLEFDETGSGLGDGELNEMDAIFANLKNQGVISKSGTHFLYQEDESAPQFKSCSNMNVARRFMGEVEESDVNQPDSSESENQTEGGSSDLTPIPMSYCGYIQINF